MSRTIPYKKPDSFYFEFSFHVLWKTFLHDPEPKLPYDLRWDHETFKSIK